jgi:pimeloyl-ACP methyl ester carboxylesterase
MIQSIVLLLAVLLAVGLILWLATAQVIAQSILGPPRMTDGKAVYVLKRLSPGDLGLPFAEQRFEVRDSARPTGPPIELAAWWIPAEHTSDRCVVLIHGYADAKVGSIAWAPMWHGLGFNILAIDLRAHGESGGRDCTAGFYERHDLNELLDRLRSLRSAETRELVLFGVSMGAAVALATAAMRDDLMAVVIDSPFADYRAALRRHLDRLGLPPGITATLAIWLAQVISGTNFASVRPVMILREVGCPVMLIRGEAEEFLTAAECKAFDDVMLQRGDRFHHANREASWVVPGVGHLGALRADAVGYSNRVSDFLARCGAKV